MSKKFKISNEVKELRLLFEISRLFDNIDDLAGHLDGALNLITKYTGMMRGAVALAGDGEGFSAFAAIGQQPGDFHYKIGQDAVICVLESGRSAAVSRDSKEPLFLNNAETFSLDKENIYFFCVPIKIESQTIGALLADRLFADSVNQDEDLRLLGILASLLGQAAKVRHDIEARQHFLEDENRRYKNFLKNSIKSPFMVGRSKAVKDVRELVSQAASGHFAVLIQGEEGTGKCAVAETIHAQSEHADTPFIKIDCSAFSEGAENSIRPEEAVFDKNFDFFEIFEIFGGISGGTLFLAGIDQLTLSAQARLLECITENEKRPGGVSGLSKARLIAATTLNLKELTEQGIFLKELFIILANFSMKLPPLRERLEDLPDLADYFLKYWEPAAEKKLPELSLEFLADLQNRAWAKNIKELSRVIARMVIGHDDRDDFRRPGQLLSKAIIDENAITPVPTLPEALDRLEKQLIIQALEEHNGNMSQVAKKLGISERIMGLRMKKFELDFKGFRAGSKN